MNRSFLRLLVAVIGLLVWTSLASAAEPPDRFDLKKIDSYLAAHALEKGRVGLSVAIAKNGKLILARGYGSRSLEERLATEAGTQFAIGSVTKQFTCACVLLLAQEGKLSVRDKVSK
jgi:CubicO group peptidase (beta-lactamase class C family)